MKRRKKLKEKIDSLVEVLNGIDERDFSFEEEYRSNLTGKIAPSFLEIHEDIKAHKHTHYMLSGGRGSTKSSFVSLEIIEGLKKDKKANCVVLRKIGLNLKDSVYEQLIWAIDSIGDLENWNYKKSPLEITYIPTGQKILFRGADNPKKIKSTKFSKGYCKYIWYEELDEFSGMNEIRTINQSLIRGGDDFFIFYSYNPPKFNRNWVNKEVLLENPDRLVHHSTYLSVPKEWLGEQFFNEAEYLKSINERAYRHEYLGEITGTGGSVFENLEIRRISNEEIRNFDRIYNGVDWGWFPDPWAFNRVYYDSARRTMYVFQELNRIKKSNRETADELKKLGLMAKDKIIADNSENKSISEYRSLGLFCKPCVKGAGSVNYSIKFIQSLSKIIIDPKRCPKTADEFMNYEYVKDKSGEFVEGYVDKNNHHIDAVRYAMQDVIRRRGV